MSDFVEKADYFDDLNKTESMLKALMNQLTEHDRGLADIQRRVKSLEWLARGDVEELPEEEWWGDKFNKAVDIVRRLADAQDLAALHGLHYEAIELMKNFPKNG